MSKRYDEAWLTCLAFNNPKELCKQVKEVRKAAGQVHMDGDDLVAQIGGGM